MKNNYRTIIGRDISMAFTADSAAEIAARVDTGAYRSALHADKIEERDGRLYFRVLGGHPIFKMLSFTTSVEDYTTVSIENSFGHSQTRYEVPLKVKIAGKVFIARFSLADRSKKKYPVLIGRTLLSKRFLVDTSISNLDKSILKKQGVQMPDDEETENS